MNTSVLIVSSHVMNLDSPIYVIKNKDKFILSLHKLYCMIHKMPKDILLNGHFAERTFCRWSFSEQTFCRTDSLPKGEFAEKKVVILSKCLGL
jgi:hypothetical protein